MSPGHSHCPTFLNHLLLLSHLSSVLLSDPLPPLFIIMNPSKDTFKTSHGSFERLTSDNYPQWSASMSRLLKAEELWEIVNGEENCPKPSDASNDTTDSIRAFNKRMNKAGVLLHNACSLPIRVYIEKLDNPAEIWKALKARVDSAASNAGRQTLKTKLYTTKPIPGESISIWFEKLLQIRNQLSGSSEEIDDTELRSVLQTGIPAALETALKIELKYSKDASIESIMDAVKEEESMRALRNQPAAATDAFYAKRSKENTNQSQKWCSFCRSNTHTYAACFKRDKSTPSFNPSHKRQTPIENIMCFHCGELGHKVDSCPIKRKANEARFKRRRQDSSATAQAASITPASASEDRDAGAGY